MKSKISRYFTVPLVLCFAIVACTANGADQPPGQTVDMVTKGLAEAIHQFVKGKVDAIKVGSFEGPPNAGQNLSIEKQLTEHLQAKGLTVVANGEIGPPKTWIVRGSYSHQETAGKDRMMVQVHAELFDEQNTQQKNFTANPYVFAITALDNVAEATESSFDESNKKDLGGVSEAILVGAKRPNTEVVTGPDESTRVSAKKGSKFAVELHVANGKTLSPTKADFAPLKGRVERVAFETDAGDVAYARADLRPGEFYAIKIYNSADFDIGVRLLIDGLSTFEFSEIPANKKHNIWVVGRRNKETGEPGVGMVYGWHRNDEYSDLFEVAHLPETEVFKMNRSQSRMGIIQAIIFPLWREDEQPPLNIAETFGSESLLPGTKRGAQIENKITYARRFVGTTPVSSIVLRYTKPQDDLPPPN